MGIIEIIAVVTGIISVLLTIKQNILCWVFGLISSILLALYFFEIELYGQFVLQLVATYQSLLGIIKWKIVDSKIISRYGIGNIFIVVGLTTLGFALLGIRIPEFSLIQIFDYFGAFVAIFATYLLINKKIEAWWLYMINNVIVASVCIYNDSYYIVVLNILFIVMSVVGYREWKKNLE